MRRSLILLSTIVALALCVELSDGLRWNLMDLHRKPPTSKARSSRSLPFQYLDQRVDNFNPQNFATFQQAYLENDEFFADNGPLLIFIGGEWVVDAGPILGGHIFDMAEEFNATLLYPEHRFYGRSQPTEDLSTDNLRYLTVEQALADLANFIVQIKRNQLRYANSKVILVGGSYSATMAAWFRQKYPHLAIGAWASSAPFLAKVDFLEYKEVAGASIHSIGGRSCYNRIENAISAAEQLIAENRWAEFRQHFALCEGIGSHPLDAYTTFNAITSYISVIIQYHRPGDIEGMCEKLMFNATTPSDDLTEFGRFFRTLVGLTDPSDCMEAYEDTIQAYHNVSLSAPVAQYNARQWLYQTCTEFGWYHTSTSEHQPFGSSFPTELFYHLCLDIYGEHINSRTMHAAADRTNVVFGAWNPNVRNVYFTNGLVDPWRAMSIQEDLNEWSPADIIPDASHCLDLQSVSASDSVEMLHVKNRIRSLVRTWLAL